MAHKHSVYDTDPHFSIDAATRIITNLSTNKTKIIQFDHNSERFTFEIPRFIDGHDMSLSDKVEIQYINVSANKNQQNADVYLCDDVQLSPDDENVVIFSWLLSKNATQYAGTLNFLIRFTCLDGDKVTYAWNTAIFQGIAVSDGMNNGEAIIEEYSDVLAAWRYNIDNNLIKSIVQTVTSDEDGGVNVLSIVQGDGTVTNFEVKNGSKGEQGFQGEKGDKGDKGDAGVGLTDTGKAGQVLIMATDGNTEWKNVGAENISSEKVEFTRTIYIENVSLLDYMWLKSGDLYTAKENFKRTDFIEVEPNKEYSLCVYYRNATCSGTVSNGKIFDKDKNIIADLGDGEEHIINITMPENAKYIQLSVNIACNFTRPNNSGISTSEMYCQYTTDTIELDWLKLKSENIPDGLITPEMLNESVKFAIGENEVKAKHIDSEAEKQYGENLLDGATYIDGEYVVTGDPNGTGNHGSLSYTEIPVIGGKEYAITVYDKSLYQNICRFNNIENEAEWEINKSPYYTFKPTDIADNVFIVKAPETAVKLYLNVRIAEQSTAIVKEVIAIKKPLDWLELKPENLTDETVEHIVEKVEETENAIIKYKYGDSLSKPFDFTNKAIVAFGDSITAGVTSPNLASTENSYIKLFANKFNMGFEGRASSGTCITDSENAAYSIYKRVTAYTGTANFIVISGGTNDFNTGKPLGDYNSTDITTFYGAMRGICEYLKTNFANATVIFITPIPVTKNYPNAILPLNAYRNAIYEIATLYGFNVVNGDDLGLPNTAGGWANDMIADTDGCHPTEAGHALYFRNLCGKLL